MAFGTSRVVLACALLVLAFAAMPSRVVRAVDNIDTAAKQLHAKIVSFGVSPPLTFFTSDANAKLLLQHMSKTLDGLEKLSTKMSGARVVGTTGVEDLGSGGSACKAAEPGMTGIVFTYASNSLKWKPSSRGDGYSDPTEDYYLHENPADYYMDEEPADVQKEALKQHGLDSAKGEQMTVDLGALETHGGCFGTYTFVDPTLMKEFTFAFAKASAGVDSKGAASIEIKVTMRPYVTTSTKPTGTTKSPTSTSPPTTARGSTSTTTSDSVSKLASTCGLLATSLGIFMCANVMA